MITIKPLPALSDNYIWLLIAPEHRQVICIDPGEAKPVCAFLAAKELSLAAILITHHHWDHTAGLKDLLAFQPTKVFAAEPNYYATAITQVNDKDWIDVPCFPPIQVLSVPGHTLDHVAFHMAGHLFTGDTLFSAGCGRLFEGDAATMYHSLGRLQQFPASTQIYSGHEYTLKNLRFAEQVEPHNTDIKQAITRIQALKGKPSLPSTLAFEQQVNPFLRCHHPAVQETISCLAHQPLKDPVDIFHHLRQWKDNF